MNFDPSQLDPKTLMEMSQLVQQLPPDQINRMQSIMHNMMAGFDVRKDMEEFEKSLPPGFREKLMSVMGGVKAAAEPPKDIKEARLTILRAVAENQINPDEALLLLFPHET